MSYSGKRPATGRWLLAIAIVTFAPVTACSSNSASTAATTALSTESVSESTNGVAFTSTTNPTVDTAVLATVTRATVARAAPTTVPPTLPGGGGGADEPCGLADLSDVQVVLPGAPPGEATVPSNTSGTIVAGSCKYVIDQQHRVVIQIETAPAQIIAAAKAGAANQTDLAKVAGLGDIGYSSGQDGDSAVIFYVADTQVQILAFGQPNTALVVALAKKVATAL